MYAFQVSPEKHVPKEEVVVWATSLVEKMLHSYHVNPNFILNREISFVFDSNHSFVHYPSFNKWHDAVCQLTFSFPRLFTDCAFGPHEYSQFTWILPKEKPTGWAGMFYTVAHEVAHIIVSYRMVQEHRWYTSWDVDITHSDEWAETYIDLIIQFQDQVQ